MIEITRIYISIGLILLTLTLVCHLVAMGHPYWKIHEHRRMPPETISVGIFRRCEKRLITFSPNLNETYPICHYNKYYFFGNQACNNTLSSIASEQIQQVCYLGRNSCNCDYSPIAKGLISCTIIAACTIGISLLLIFSHILINQFKYKIHMYLAALTIFLLLLGFVFILITLILLGSTMSYDLYQYRYNLDYQLAGKNAADQTSFKDNITKTASEYFETRLDWCGGLEIIALILLAFTLITQIVYLFSTYRNRIG